MLNNIKEGDQLGKWLMVLTGMVIVIYPTTRFVVEDIRSLYLVLLFLLSVVAFSFRWSQCKAISLSRSEKILLSCFFLMFIVTLMSFVILGGDHDGQRRVGVYLGFLLGLPVYYLFRLYMPSSRLIWAAIVIACYIVAVRSWLEMNGYVNDIAWVKLAHDRANGTMHPIRFGDLSLVIGFISLAGALYIQEIKTWMKIMGVLGFLCGGYASVMSQSRGGWVAIPALLLIVLWPLFRKITLKYKVGVILSILLGTVLMFNVPELKINERFEQASSDIELYQKGDSNTSIGLRFDMFEAAYQIFSEYPLFGVGVGNYVESINNYYGSNKESVSNAITQYDNPHNEFLFHMVTRGLIGIVLLLVLFGTGIVMFFSKMKKHDNKNLFYAVSGLMVLVAYMHFGMSISLFKHRDFLLFFVIYVLLFAAGVNKKEIDSKKRSFEK